MDPTREFLYHGSVQKNLLELQPSNGKLFASPDFRVATIFLAGAQRAFCMPINGRMFAFIGDDREALLTRDCGGSIYVLTREAFHPVPGGNPSVEWFTTEKITPIMSFVYESSIAAMVAHGVQLHFVSLTMLNQIEAADRAGDLKNLDILVPVLAKGSENAIFRTLLLKHGPTLNPKPDSSSHMPPQL
jgi:hypothetical protein